MSQRLLHLLTQVINTLHSAAVCLFVARHTNAAVVVLQQALCNAVYGQAHGGPSRISISWGLLACTGSALGRLARERPLPAHPALIQPTPKALNAGYLSPGLIVWLLSTVGLCIGLGSPASAQIAIPSFLHSSVTAPAPSASAWVLLENSTGWVITSSGEKKRVDPASLTKLMTAYLTFEALENGTVSATDSAYISNKAWKSPGSRMFLEVDSFATIEALIKGLIIQSGNDAAVALSEHLGGSEAGFAKQMNEKAHALGMLGTHYINASGLPDPDHYTTALDTAILSRAIILTFPELYALFSVHEYTYNEITQTNRNDLLQQDSAYDGLKTGHTEAAGFCLAGSAKRGNTRFIAVVMGAQSKQARVQGVRSLIEYAFSHYERSTIFKALEPVKTMALFKGANQQVELGVMKDISIVLPKGRSSDVQLNFHVPEHLLAPLTRQDVVGRAVISYQGNEIGHASIHPLQDYPLGPIWTQLIDTLKLKIF